MKYDIQNIIKRYDLGDPLEFVFFWGHHGKPDRMTKACFSQWYPASFKVEGTSKEENKTKEAIRLFIIMLSFLS